MPMLANTPTPAMLEELLGPALFPVWQQLCRTIEERYGMFFLKFGHIKADK